MRKRVVRVLTIGALLSPLVLAQGTKPKSKPTDARTLRPQQDIPSASERRVALVIGNSAYKDSPLRNPVNDARAMGLALKALGFEVEVVTDAGRKRMMEAVRTFGQKLTTGGVGLFYYAGHGMAVKGANYLIPIGVDITSEDEISVEALDANLVLNKMDTAKNRLNLVILDACRNNPFARSFRSGAKGLAQMEAPAGSFVAFATAPGSTAADGEGQNGLYTQHLLRALKEPGLSVERVFKKVRVGVKSASGDQQVPWDSSSLTGEFFFQPGSTGLALAEPAVPGVAAMPVHRPSLGASLASTSLARDSFETKEEWAARLSGLGAVRVGVAKVDRANYNVDTKWMKLVLEVSEAAQPYVMQKSLSMELDRNTARRLVEAGPTQPLMARVEVKGDHVELSDLRVESSVGTLKGQTGASGPLTVGLGRGVSVELIPIPADTFQMGSNAGQAFEKPVHEVTISRGFWMGKYPVTQAQWEAVMGANPSHFKGADLPVEQVSWDDAQAFVAKLNGIQSESTFRLPTEAEWEYACRAGTGGEIYGALDAIAWHEGNSDYTTHPVGQKQANAFGLHDMIGNVWEWCADWSGPYSGGSLTDPQGASSSQGRVLRGGGSSYNSEYCRAASRFSREPSSRTQYSGFRLVGAPARKP